MRKILKIVLKAIITLVLIWGLSLYLTLNTNDNFSDSNIFYYHFITPDVVKNIPKISDNYYFRYNGMPDRSESRFGVIFCNIKDREYGLNKLIEYSNENNIPISILGKNYNNAEIFIEYIDNDCIRVDYEAIPEGI